MTGSLADGSAGRPLLGADVAAPSGTSPRPPVRRSLPAWTWPLRITALLALLIFTLPAWLYVLLTDTCCPPRTPEEHRQRGRLVGWLTACCWNCALRLCCWLRVTNGAGPLQNAGKAGRSVFIASNHASMIDASLVCTQIPRWMAGDLKTLMAGVYLRSPILGRLARAIGHLPVPFTSKTRGDFGVDKEKLKETMARLDEHISHGGHLGVFPEGDLNRDWMTLSQFRAGGIEICIKHDMEVWGLVFAGSADAWPVGVALGGAPATIHCRAALLYPSARDAAELLAGADADVRAKALALAMDMREQMQAMLDELLESQCPRS